MSEEHRLRIRHHAHYLRACGQLLHTVANAATPSKYAFVDEMEEAQIIERIWDVLYRWRLVTGQARGTEQWAA